MITKIYKPSSPLKYFIDHFFYYTDYNPNHHVECFLPDGEVQLIFDLTDTSNYIYDNDTLEPIQLCRKVWLSGFRTKPISIPSGQNSEMLIVQFKKGKAFSFLQPPMQQLMNLVVDAELVMNPAILSIREQLQDISDPNQKCQVLEMQLLKIYQNQLHENPFVNFAVSTILASPNQCSIKMISDKAGYSQKHIIKMFKEQVGVTPKTFLRVVRFQKAIQQIEMQNHVDWSAVAYDGGYYDQSHFIADFKHFSGFSPTQYIKQRGEFINYIPLNVD